MYGRRYSTVSSGVTRSMHAESSLTFTPIAPYTLHLRDERTLTGVAFYGKHKLECEGLRRLVNSMTNEQYQTTTIVVAGQTIRVADIARLTQ